MANIKEIQDRMRSIQDTLKITNAMYMISTTFPLIMLAALIAMRKMAKND